MTEDTRSFERWSEPHTDGEVATPGTTAGLPDPDSALAPTPDAARSATSTMTRPPVGVMDPEAQAASRTRTDAVPSTAAIAGHPIHPMVVPIPIGLLTGALLSDLAYAATRDRFWARASLALTAGGVVGGLASAVFGATDFVSKRQIRDQRIAWLHGGGNALIVAMGAASVALRSRDPERAVLPAGLAMSLTSATLLLVTGWLGGELVYRYRVGVMPR